MTDSPPPIDTSRLAAIIRGRDEASREALNLAYRRVFSGVDGHLVLLHLVANATVIVKPDTSPDERTYHLARQATVLSIANRAGHDPLGLAAALLTGHMEGQDHGGSRHQHQRSRPILDDVDPDGF